MRLWWETMSLTKRPSFYIIVLLILTMAALTVYVMDRLTEAEALARAKKNAAPAALPTYQP